MGASFRFGDYGNPGADRKAAPFFRVALRRGTNQAAVEPKDLQERVAFGGCAVHGELIIAGDLAFDKGAQPFANSANAAAEFGIGPNWARLANCSLARKASVFLPLRSSLFVVIFLLVRYPRSQ